MGNAGSDDSLGKIKIASRLMSLILLPCPFWGFRLSLGGIVLIMCFFYYGFGSCYVVFGCDLLTWCL